MIIHPNIMAFGKCQIEKLNKLTAIHRLMNDNNQNLTVFPYYYLLEAPGGVRSLCNIWYVPMAMKTANFYSIVTNEEVLLTHSIMNLVYANSG